jgi:hypothetical protein
VEETAFSILMGASFFNSADIGFGLEKKGGEGREGKKKEKKDKKVV